MSEAHGISSEDDAVAATVISKQTERRRLDPLPQQALNLHVAWPRPKLVSSLRANDTL